MNFIKSFLITKFSFEALEDGPNVKACDRLASTWGKLKMILSKFYGF